MSFTADGRIPVLVLNLREAAQRRQMMSARLSALGVAFEFFEAVDGRTMTDDARAALHLGACLRDYGRQLTPSEVGCCMSYINLMRKISEGPEPYVCVLEDDARPTAMLPSVLSRSCLDALPSFDILRLVMQKHRQRKSPYLPIAKIGDHAVVAPLGLGFLATGQIVSRQGAQRLAPRLVPVTAPIDNMLYRDPVVSVRVLEVRPSVIDFDHLETHMVGRDDVVATARAERGPIDVLKRNCFLAYSHTRAWLGFFWQWGPLSAFRLRWPDRSPGLSS
jgi:glycosyl transferase, family 25